MGIVDDEREPSLHHLLYDGKGEMTFFCTGSKMYQIRRSSDPFFNRRLISRLQSVSLSDAARAARRHLAPFARVKESIIAAACAGKDLAKRIARYLPLFPSLCIRHYLTLLSREFALSEVMVEKRVDMRVVEDLSKSIYAM